MTAATITSPTDDRHLIAAASRALRAAGWTADSQTHADYRHSRSTGRSLVQWLRYDDEDDAVWVLSIWRPVAGHDEMTEVAVTSVQQAVDIVAALTGVGHHLTTGATLAAGGGES